MGFDGVIEVNKGIPRVLATSLIRLEIKHILHKDTH
jgi:hypothetical protein